MLWDALLPSEMSSASSSSEAAAPPGAEPATAGMLWERAWSLEEIRGGSQGWSLAADAGVRGAMVIAANAAGAGAASSIWNQLLLTHSALRHSLGRVLLSQYGFVAPPLAL